METRDFGSSCDILLADLGRLARPVEYGILTG